MRHIGMSKLQHLLFVLLLFALTGCGASDGTTKSGALKTTLDFNAAGKTTAKTVSAIPVGSGVTKVRLTVSGKDVPIVRNEIAVTEGSAGDVTVTGIYPGTVTLVVQAMDDTGAIKFEGFALNVVVTADATTDVGTITMTVPTVKAADAGCLGCHETTIDVNGQNLVADFKQSGHYKNLAFVDANGVATGCFGCHGNHAIKDPSANFGSRCFECHNSNPALVTNHENYVKNATACSACHEMHNTKAAQEERVLWAASGHANTGGPFAGHSTGGCSRCHNPQGLIAVLADPTFASANQPTVSVAQTLVCSACHTNATTGALRTMAGTKADTNYTTDLGWSPLGYTLAYGKKAYPDVAASNICIQCHDSRQSDPGAIVDTTSTFSRTHYLQAAATMYVKMGFLNLSTGGAADGQSSAAYRKTLMSDQDGGSVTSTHRKLGTPAINGDSHNPSFFVAGNLDSNGPCVTCHLGGSHSWKIDQKAITAVCNKCHSSESNQDITTITAFDTFFIEPQSEAYLNSAKLAMDVFNSKGLGITLAFEGTNTFIRAYKTAGLTLDANGIIISGSEATYVEWAAAMTTLGADWNRTKLLGAVANVQLLLSDPGVYAHARTYSRRLLYDSIDYLDDGSLNMSVGATALVRSALPAGSSSATNSTVSGLFNKGTAAFTNGTLTALKSPTTEAMTFLIKWSRSDGTWSTPERP